MTDAGMPERFGASSSQYDSDVDAGIANAIRELADATHESALTMNALVAQVSRDADLRDRKVDLLQRQQKDMKLLLWLMAIGVLIIIAMGVTNAVNISNARANSALTANIAKNAQSTNNLLLDCLNSQGECGRRNAQQQKAILDDVKRYQLVAIYCARKNPSADDQDGVKYMTCVDELFPGGPRLRS